MNKNPPPLSIQLKAMTAMKFSLCYTINESTFFFNLCHIDDKGSGWNDCGTHYWQPKIAGDADVNVTTETHEVILAPSTTTTAGTFGWPSSSSLWSFRPRERGTCPNLLFKELQNRRQFTHHHLCVRMLKRLVRVTHTRMQTHTHAYTHGQHPSATCQMSVLSIMTYCGELSSHEAPYLTKWNTKPFMTSCTESCSLSNRAFLEWRRARRTG